MSDDLRAEVERLEARVTELQAEGSRLENERRKWKAIATATREILMRVVIDVPVAARVTGMGEADIRPELNEHFAALLRIEQLERDAWSGAAQLAREFIKAVEKAEAKHYDISGEADLATAASEYAEKFKTLLDPK